jgi:hypothetical protein
MRITRWAGTATYMVGMLLTALNIFPLNLIFGAMGGVLWCMVGIQWKDRALIIVEAASALIYLAGLVKWSFDTLAVSPIGR